MPTPRVEPGERHRVSRSHCLAALLAAGVTFVVFLPSLSNGWVMWDDDMNFLSNPRYRGLSLEHLRWMFTTFHGGPYQPLSWMTLAVDYLVWGEDRPFGYHLTNVLLHAACAGLLTVVAARLYAEKAESRKPKTEIGDWQPQSSSSGAEDGPARSRERSESGIAFGLVVALIWSLHPLRVEAVSWITERREVLCGLLSLAAMPAHLAGSGRRRVFVWSALAMLAKGSAVTLPAMLVLIDLYRQAATGNADVPLHSTVLQSLRRHAAVIALAGGISGLALFGQHDAAAMITLDKAPVPARLAIFANGVSFYALKTAWPAGLAPLYEAPRVLADLYPAGIAGGAALLGALGVGWLLRKRTMAPLLLVTAYVVMLLPVGGLVQVGSQIAADRYAYQPGWAMSLLAAMAVAALVRSRTKWMLCVGLLTAGLLVAPTLRLQRIWRDTASLWAHTLRVFPDSAMANFNAGIDSLGKSPSPSGDARAEPYFRKVAKLLPAWPPPHYELAGILVRRGQLAAGEAAYREALRLDPAHANAHNGLVRLLWHLNRRDEAISQLRDHVPHSRDPVRARFHVAAALAAADHADEAVAEYQRVLAERPDDRSAQAALSRLWSTHPSDAVRNGPDALALAQRAWDSPNGRTIEVAEALALALAETGRREQALQTLNQVASRLPSERRARWVRLADLLRAGQPVRLAPTFTPP